MWRHVLRPSSLNTLTAAGLNVGGLIGGAFIVEALCSPTRAMGRLLIQSIFFQEYFIVAAIVAIHLRSATWS